MLVLEDGGDDGGVADIPDVDYKWLMYSNNYDWLTRVDVLMIISVEAEVGSKVEAVESSVMVGVRVDIEYTTEKSLHAMIVCQQSC